MVFIKKEVTLTKSELRKTALFSFAILVLSIEMCPDFLEGDGEVIFAHTHSEIKSIYSHSSQSILTIVIEVSALLLLNYSWH